MKAWLIILRNLRNTLIMQTLNHLEQPSVNPSLTYQRVHSDTAGRVSVNPSLTYPGYI